MIQKIFMPIRGDGKSENVMRHAIAVARRFNAHVVAAYCRPRPEDMLPFGVPVPAFMRDQVTEQSKGLADAEAEKLRAEFDALVSDIGVALVSDAAEGAAASTASVSWMEAEGKQIDVIKRYGRLSDLIVVAKPDRDRNLGANTLKTALFNTARPVLMCPPAETVPAALGERIAFAWDGSLEATRALALNNDLFLAAKDVVVMSALDESAPAEHRAEACAAFLVQRGVAARPHRVELGASIGDALLREAAALGADVVVMGAYGDSHEAETFFGGVTQTVVDGAQMPVILAH